MAEQAPDAAGAPSTHGLGSMEQWSTAILARAGRGLRGISVPERAGRMRSDQRARLVAELATRFSCET